MEANDFFLGLLIILLTARIFAELAIRLQAPSVNRWLILGVVVMILAQLLFAYSPLMNQLLGSAPMGMTQRLWVLTGGLVIYAVVGLKKWQRLRSENEKEQ